MNKITLLAVIGLTAFLVSCVVPSLHPFYTEKDVVFDKDLLGIWAEENGNNIIIFREKAHNVYTVENIQESKSAQYKGHLFRLNGHLYLDLYPEYEGKNSLHSLHLIPVHSIMQCRLESDKMVLYPLNYEEIEKGLTSGQLRGLRYEKFDDRIILTSPTSELQKFIISYAEDKILFSEAHVLKKIK